MTAMEVYRQWRDRRPFLLVWRSSVTFIALCVAVGLLVDMACYSVIVPVMPFRLTSLGYSNIPAKVSYLVGAYAAGLIVSSPPVGILADHLGSRRGLLVFGLLFLMGSLIMFWQANTYALLVVARVLQGISGTFIWSLGLALICDNVAPDRLGSVMGVVMIAYSTGICIGPVVGGALYAKMGYNAPFVFALLLAFWDVVLRLLLIEKSSARMWIPQGVPAAPQDDDSVKSNSEPASPPKDKEAASTAPGAMSGWKGMILMCKSPRALTLLGVIGTFGFLSGGAFDTAQTLLLNHRYGLNSEGAGLVFLAIIIPSFVSSPLFGWGADRYGPRIPTVVALVLGSVALGLTIIRTSLPVFIVFEAFAGFFYTASNPPVMCDLAALANTTPGLGFGSVYALFNMSFSIGALIGPFAAGALLNHHGPEKGWQLTIVICVVLTIAAAGFSLFFIGGPLRWRKLDLSRQKTNEAVEMQPHVPVEAATEPAAVPPAVR